MKFAYRSSLVATAVGLVFACLARASDIGESAKRLQKHIEYLASDELEGRGPGSKGIEAAAEYIAARYKDAGLEPGGVDGTYFQPFPIALERKLVESNRLKFSGRGLDKELVQGKDFIPLSFSGS